MCGTNTFSTGAADACTSCAEGGHSHPGSSSCITCAAGSYYDYPSNSCVGCPRGKYASTGVDSEADCSDCDRGFVSTTVGRGFCMPCSAGQYVARARE